MIKSISVVETATKPNLLQEDLFENEKLTDQPPSTKVFTIEKHLSEPLNVKLQARLQDMIVSANGQFVLWRSFEVLFDSPSHTVATMELRNLHYEASDLTQFDSV